MLVQAALNVTLAKVGQDMDTHSEDVERTVVQPAQAPILIETKKNGQRREQVQDGERSDEKITEAHDKCPFGRLHQKIKTRCVAVNHWYHDEEYEAEEEANVKADSLAFAAGALCFFFFLFRHLVHFLFLLLLIFLECVTVVFYF